MDFHARLLQQLPETQVRGWKEPLPFYMAQPGYYRPGQEEQCLRDMEYLQQLYPDEIKLCQSFQSTYQDLVCGLDLLSFSHTVLS